MCQNDTELGVIWQIISVPRSSGADTRRFNGLLIRMELVKEELMSAI